MLEQDLKRYGSWFSLAFGIFPHPKERMRKIGIGDFRGYVESTSDNHVKKAFSEILDGSMASRGRLIHEDRHKQSYLFTSEALAFLPLWVKHYKRRHLGQDIKDFVRGSQARKSFLLGLQMERYDIPTPMPLAYLEKRRSGIREESFLICRGYPQSQSAPGLFQELFNTGNSENLNAALKALGDFFLKIEKTGLRHGCLMSSILAITNEDEPPSFLLIDLDQVCTIGAVDEHDIYRMAEDMYWHWKLFLPKECIRIICEEGRRINSRILERLSLFM